MKKSISIILLLLLTNPVISAACRALSTFEKEPKPESWLGLEHLVKNGKELGKGSFGTVVEVEWPFANAFSKKVAIKKLKLKKVGLQSQITELKKEVNIMKVLGEEDTSMPVDSSVPAPTCLLSKRQKSLKNQLVENRVRDGPAPNIIDCVIDRKGTSAYVIMEVLAGSLTLDCKETNKECPVVNWASRDNPDRLSLFIKIAEALIEMHDRKYVHEDLKPDNIGVTDLEANGVKLIDFGLSQKIGKQMRGGTNLYMDLDKLLWFNDELYTTDKEEKGGEMASTATDVYSLGVIFYELEYFAFASKKSLSVKDVFEDFKFKIEPVKGGASRYFQNVQETILENEGLINIGIYFCVKGLKKDKRPVCLYQVYFGMIVADRNARWELGKVVSVLQFIQRNYHLGVMLSKKDINKVQNMDLQEALEYEPKIKWNEMI